jgi:CheY-like chemotaxis protein
MGQPPTILGPGGSKFPAFTTRKTAGRRLVASDLQGNREPRRASSLAPAMPDAPFLLLVDDDDHDAFFFQNAVKAAGVSFRIHRVRDGQEAIDYFLGRHVFADRRQFPVPHITLLDLKMPRRNGFEVLRFIRSSSSFAGAVVVILTSSSDEKDIREATQLRVAAYLVKPSKVTALIEIAQQLEKLWRTLS